jgi:hypothetical protein
MIRFKSFIVQLETKNMSILLRKYASVKGLNFDQSVMCDGSLDTIHVVYVKCDFTDFHLFSTLLFAELFSHKTFL